MSKTILLTGATDGLGLRAAELIVEQGHKVILHGRRADRLAEVVSDMSAKGDAYSYCCDLSDLTEVAKMATKLVEAYSSIDVIINNAGVLKANNTKTTQGLELRFVVNTIAPYLLTKMLMPVLRTNSRVVNLSSAAQTPLDASEISIFADYTDMGAYARSKLAITAWTKRMAHHYPEQLFVSVNPGSLLGTKMVKEGFGIEGEDIMIGADIITRAALSDEFNDATGLYYDNDAKSFGPAHNLAEDTVFGQTVIDEMETLLKALNLA